MIIYEAEEAVDGLAELLFANSSIAYATHVVTGSESDKELIVNSLLDKSIKASVHDSDLYFTKSILVSTNWNLNDDVFCKYEVWASRHTPSHKRTNIEHDETKIVGHMTDTWALDSDSNIIPDNTSVKDLPDLFHIANGAVIYTYWESDDLKAQTNALIEKIQANKMFVSMEALFAGFDYAVMTPEGEFHIVARQKETAFLTKHLRAYKGKGEFDGCRLGRLLRNLTFSGKGYVEKPANPLSVIDDGIPFSVSASVSRENPFKTHNGVFISCSNVFSSNKKLENTRMSDTLSIDLLQKQNEELKATIAELQEDVKNYSKASVDEKVKAFENKISDLEGKLEAAQKELDSVKAELEEANKAKQELEEQLTEANNAKASLEEEINKAKLEKTKSDRVARLVEAGYEKDTAEAKVEAFIDLDDDKFEVIAVELIEAKKHMKDTKNKDDKSDKAMSSDSSSDDDDSTQDDAGSASASATDLDTDVDDSDTEPDMSANASDDSDEPSLREELSKALAARLGYEDNKGE